MAPDDTPHLCVLVRYPDGEQIWEPAAEYRANPPRGSYEVSEKRRPEYEPIRREGALINLR